jgi:hypothetical protein
MGLHLTELYSNRGDSITMDHEDVVAALVSLAESGIPHDVQELLVHGDARRGIPAGALYRALVTARIERERRNGQRGLKMRTKEELDQWLKEHPFPRDPTPAESAAWHLAAIEFEFGKGSYFLAAPKPLPR